MTTDFAPSYYEASVRRPSFAAEDGVGGEMSADVCVIGGGFTGMSCALELARRGRSVVLLEGRAVGWGASGRNGGQIINGYSTSALGRISRQTGVSEKQLFDFSVEAIALLRRRVEEFSIDCDLRRGHAEAIVKRRDADGMRRWADKLAGEYDYPHLTVMDAVRFREVVASRRYCGGVVDANGGHLHPLKYLLGLAGAAAAAGVKICENSPVTGVRRDGGLFVSVGGGSGGKGVRCRAVVFACNAYGGELSPPARAARMMPVGTYIGATAPLPAGEADALIAGGIAVADTNFILDYYRCSADGRLLFGGRAHYSGRPPPDLKQSLHRRMVAVFPQLSDLSFEYAWGGNVAITVNRFPDIGREGKDVYYAQGFSGHGVALTGFAGKIIAEALVGDEEKLDVFTRVRHMPFPGGRFFRMPLLVLAMLYYRLRDLL